MIWGKVPVTLGRLESRLRRYTWLDVDERPAPMLTDLRQLLAGQPAH